VQPLLHLQLPRIRDVRSISLACIAACVCQLVATGQQPIDSTQHLLSLSTHLRRTLSTLKNMNNHNHGCTPFCAHPAIAHGRGQQVALPVIEVNDKQ
jgi:hypothetical protein